MAFLSVKDIYKSFGKTEVLKGVSFDLSEGEVLSIIGSSGNGKTTLLRCLNYLERADKGTVLLNGEKIFNGDEKKSPKAFCATAGCTSGWCFKVLTYFRSIPRLKTLNSRFP